MIRVSVGFTPRNVPRTVLREVLRCGTKACDVRGCAPWASRRRVRSNPMDMPGVCRCLNHPHCALAGGNVLTLLRLVGKPRRRHHLLLLWVLGRNVQPARTVMGWG